MDYPFHRKIRYDVSNNWWFLPTDLFKVEKDKESEAHVTDFYSPIVSYMDDIKPKDKFKYIVIMLVIVVFIYRLDLPAAIWIGLVVGVGVAYYLNELESRDRTNEAEELWYVLQGPLLKHTKYFITDPLLIRWIDDVSELKTYNTLEFNKMVKTLDDLLHMNDDFRKGVHLSKDNLDLFRDLKTASLNQFHSLIYKIPTPVLRNKYNYYLNELGKILNDHQMRLLRICQIYYLETPVTTDSHFSITSLSDPTPNDLMYEKHYNFYN